MFSSFTEDKVKRLLDFIILEPEEDDQKVGHKFPFISSELLNCDVAKINELFVTTQGEMYFKRKVSTVSNQDSDLVVTSGDQADHVRQHKEEEKNSEILDQALIEPEEEVTHDQEIKIDNEVDIEKDTSSDDTQENKQEHLDHLTPIDNENNKSINDLINFYHSTEEHNNIPNKNRIELLDYLLSFLDTKEELNYVLAGYFSKFFNHLLNKHATKILNYLYIERSEVFDWFAYHCDKRGITEILPKLLQVENYCQDIKTHAEEIRKNVLITLFKKLDVKSENVEKNCNLVYACIEIIENKNILDVLLNETPILEHIIDQLSTQESEIEDANFNFNYQEIMNILINIVKFSQLENLKLPTYKNESNDDMVTSDVTSQGIDNTLLGEILLEKIDKILINHFNTQIQTEGIEGTFGLTYKPLGIKKLKICELVLYLFSYFKNITSVFDNILIQNNFFKMIIQYFFEYEWNNMLQYHFDNILNYYLNNVNNHQEITKHLFDELKILNVFMNYGNISHNFSFNSNKKINNGYFAILIEICHKINQIGIGASLISPRGSKEIYFSNFHSEQSNYNSHYANQSVQLIANYNISQYFTTDWEFFVQEKVNYWIKLFQRKLCMPDTPNNVVEDSKVNFNFNEPASNYQKEETSQDQSENPFKSNKEEKDDNFFSNQQDEEWFSSSNRDNQVHDNMLEDINGFEFVEDKFNTIDLGLNDGAVKSKYEYILYY